MGLAQSTGEFLRSLDNDAVHLRDQGLQRLPDERIVVKTMEEERTIITHDLDF
jgi:predicted nuclease of predicted toxin-antitoxin system